MLVAMWRGMRARGVDLMLLMLLLLMMLVITYLVIEMRVETALA